MYATLLQKFKKNVVGLKFEIADIYDIHHGINFSFEPFIHNICIYAWLVKKT